MNGWIELIERIVSSESVSLIIALSAVVVLGWGWWYRERIHIARYERIEKENSDRISELLKSIDERDERVINLAKDAYTAIGEMSKVLAGIERAIQFISECKLN